ncbi:MAG: preprotein translocase subunit YajC [Candidatus Ornithospirochaeta sp.]
MNSLALMAADSASSASLTSSLIMFAAIILIFYFLIYRPQKKRDKEAKAMLAAMKKGDKVVTIGGIHGTVVTVKDKTVVIKVDDSARIEFSKEAISSVTSKDAVKTAPEKKNEEKKEEKPAEITEGEKKEEK